MATCATFAAFTTGPAALPCAPVCVLNQIEANLAALVSGGFLTVHVGKFRPAETDDTDDDLRAGAAETIGIFAYDISSSEQRGQRAVGTLNVKGLLEVHLPTDTTSRMACFYSLCEMIKGALSAEASFFSCSSRPLLVTYVPTQDVEDDKIMHAEFQASYAIPMTAATL